MKIYCLAFVQILFFASGLTSTPGQNYSQKPEVAKSQLAGAPKKKEVKIERVDFSKGKKAKWIWCEKSGQNYFFRASFDGTEVETAHLIATCDNVMNLKINGKSVAQSSTWESPTRKEITKFVKDGENQILVDAKNQGGVAGFVAKIVLKLKNGKSRQVISDQSWTAALASDSKNFAKVKIVGTMGKGVWGNVFARSSSNLAGGPRDIFNVLPGFQVEKLFTVPKNDLGSWVSICTDNKGRLIVSDQSNKGLCRITPPTIGSDEETKVERLKLKISSAQGLLYAFDSLYISVNGGQNGLYRAKDTNGDDQFDELKKLKSIHGGGEHGPHALRLSPDGKSIFWIAGNHTNPPKGMTKSRIPTNWGEDLLLPRQWDARGHAAGKLAPGGWIVKTDPNGKNFEMFSMGYRNPYDMDFNADGELFAYDADMEWDMGTPWYRPTRIVHATSGSEFGWRSGTGKWPTYYVDSLPPTVDIGPGSPVGAEFGYGAKFPAKYQKALFICDWTFGTMYAIHLQPNGASYKATKEEFVSRTPLPLTDVTIGKDGAMYFTVGGRGAQSELFRVTYVGKKSTEPAKLKDEEFADLRKIRRRMEVFHTRTDPAAVGAIWPYLSHKDRHIRYAARVALEKQDIENVQSHFAKESNPLAVITASVAIARQGKKDFMPNLVSASDAIDFSSLDESAQLDLLRAYQLTFIRMGQPSKDMASDLAEKLGKFYPAKSDNLNRELVNLLVYLNSPTVISKTLKMMENPVEQKPDDIQ